MKLQEITRDSGIQGVGDEVMGRLVPVIMGSKSDDSSEHNKKLYTALERYGMPYARRIASAHKHPAYLLGILEEYDASGLSIVYITVAGRSDALSGAVAANTVNPVIACPPPSSEYGGMTVVSTIYTPSRSPPMYVKDPENAALAVARIFAMNDQELRERLRQEIVEMRTGIENDDQSIRTL